MDGQLLVRTYNVGLGDCIYLCIPDVQRKVHVLIDCGNKFGSLDRLGECIEHLKGDLPQDENGKHVLDLLVVSHPHEDHHKGFEEAFFDGLQIKNLWLSPAYDDQNPKAHGFRALQAAGERALNSLMELAQSEDVRADLAEMLSLTKSEAIQMLRFTLPERSGIQVRYVSADTPPEDLFVFEDPEICLKVLGPMEDIDGFYLGGEGAPPVQEDSNELGLAERYAVMFPKTAALSGETPKNISSQDFRTLRSHMSDSALAAASLAGHMANNLSVVLLLEWHGRRLLFTGDAEWNGAYRGAVEKGRSNGSWNVMWQEKAADLSTPLDFLKVGHHGSKNATPWTGKKNKKGEFHPINAILDALLPLPTESQQPIAFAVVSTERTSRWPSIPDPALMEELGRRVANVCDQYTEDHHHTHVPDGRFQPQRTDLEGQVVSAGGEPVECIEVFFNRKEPNS